MSAASASGRGRVAAERIMVDSCVVTRQSATATVDPETGQMIRTTRTLYTGKCRVKPEAGTSVGDVAAGQTALPKVTPVVSVPVSVTGVEAGDRVKITSPSHDSGLDGATLLVRAVGVGTYITARRLICEVL
jgi:Family of unknown function (DUF6093)